MTTTGERPRALSAATATCSRLLVLGLTALAVSLGVASPVRADVFGPISLASVGSLGGGPAEQVDYGHDAAISGDGRFVVFDGSVAGATGVWRRDLATGSIEQVAGGDAELPSVSENGQFISFTTNEGASLPAITNGLPDETPRQEAVNVYVRNMALVAGEEGAFLIVSAANGTEEPLRYGKEAETKFGSAAAGRSAISADGNAVAFVTTAVSNLTKYPALEAEEEGHGLTPAPHTPALQVAVRRIATRETILVSGEYDKASGETTTVPVPEEEGLGGAYVGNPTFRAAPQYDDWGPDGAPAGASISADGSTVAWMGANIAKQAPMLSAESPPARYTEPLWRRIGTSVTPTERVTGGSEPAAQACVESGEAILPSSPSLSDPCLGPFIPAGGGPRGTGIWAVGGGNASGVGNFVPRLSADGYKVAFISAAPLVALGGGFNAGSREGQEADLYVADMHPGLSRKAALAPITELAGAFTRADTDPVREFDISADGEQIAFTTRRTAFPLALPAPVSAPLAEPGLNELFDADLHDGTLTQVTQGYDGGPSELPHTAKKLGEEDAYEFAPGGGYAGAESPSFSADGTLLAFGSQASNLVVGDGNTPPAGFGDGGDAFVVGRQLPGVLATPQSVSAAPDTPTAPAWQLGVTALSEADGSVRLYVSVPGAGLLRARAAASVLVSAAHGSSAAQRDHHRAGRSGRSGRVARRRPMPTAVSRTVATAARSVGGADVEVLELVLRLARPYASLASQRGGLSANVTLSFTAAGHPAISQSIEVSFQRTAHPARLHNGSSSKNHKRGHR